MDAGFTAVRLGRALAVVCAVLALGTVGFHAAHDEGWLQSLYRAVLAGSLSGVELVPGNDPAQAVSVFMVLSGLTIFAYIAAVLVEGIARGVFTGALVERRRRRMIDRLRDHYVICGYGRVGRRVADVRARGLVASSEPYPAAGREMGILVLQPQVAAFLDAASIAGGQDLPSEEALAG